MIYFKVWILKNLDEITTFFPIADIITFTLLKLIKKKGLLFRVSYFMNSKVIV